jgi:DNA-3-methyladenine glycosylase
MGRADTLKTGRHKGGHPLLSRPELPVDTVSLPRYLIGKILVREMAEGVASGRIVETEAYVVGDAAGYRGMTRPEGIRESASWAMYALESATYCSRL